MLLTFLLPLWIHYRTRYSCHNLRAKKKSKNDMALLSGTYALCVKSRWCGK